MTKKKMKLDWKSVNECERNYVGQEVNQYGDECDFIYEIFQAEGPVCECGNKMLLMKCNIEKSDGEIEEIPDITSICHTCNVEDDGFFTENENNEIQWDEEE